MSRLDFLGVQMGTGRGATLFLHLFSKRLKRWVLLKVFFLKITLGFARGVFFKQNWPFLRAFWGLYRVLKL